MELIFNVENLKKVGNVLVEPNATLHNDTHIAAEKFTYLLYHIAKSFRIHTKRIYLFYARSLPHLDCIAFQKRRQFYFNILPYIEQHWDFTKKETLRLRRPIQYWFYHFKRISGKPYNGVQVLDYKSYRILQSLCDTILGCEYDADGHMISFYNNQK